MHDQQSIFAWDFDCDLGAEVLAVRQGEVLFVRDGFDANDTQNSNAVLIAHDNETVALYGHLSPGILVSEGDTVVQGQVLARSGNSGISSAPHLHFHVMCARNGKWMGIPIEWEEKV